MYSPAKPTCSASFCLLRPPSLSLSSLSFSVSQSCLHYSVLIFPQRAGSGSLRGVKCVMSAPQPSSTRITFARCVAFVFVWHASSNAQLVSPPVSAEAFFWFSFFFLPAHNTLKSSSQCQHRHSLVFFLKNVGGLVFHIVR